MKSRSRRGNRQAAMKARLGIATAVLVGGGAIGLAAVAAAVERAGAGDVVERLALGLETQLGPTWPDGAELSFGQWQKLALARGFMRDEPLLLILDEPTRGVDVGAKAEIYALIQQLLEKGMVVLFISSELPEIVGVCDRVLVMREGEITGEVGGKTGIEITQQNIMKFATDVTRSASNGN